MSQEEISLKPPAGIVSEPSKRMSFDFAKRSPISKEKMEELEKATKKMLEDSRTNTTTMRKRLNSLNDVRSFIDRIGPYVFVKREAVAALSELVALQQERNHGDPYTVAQLKGIIYLTPLLFRSRI